jgi:hypothetical protein
MMAIASFLVPARHQPAAPAGELFDQPFDHSDD